jgi:ribonuclease P protein component
MAGVRRETFPKRMRLTHSRQFAAVYNAGKRRSSGPITVIALANGLEHNRLGLSIGRRVGGAVARSRLKRCLREAFRLIQHDAPTGYDIVVVARPHDPLPQPEYQRLLQSALERVHRAAGDRPAGPLSEESSS